MLPAAQPGHHLLLRRGDQEDGHGLRHQAADGGRALHIDAQHHVQPAGQPFAHLGLGDALVVAVDHGMLQQLLLLDHLGEALDADEVVVLAVDLAGPLGAGGRRHHLVEGHAQLVHVRHDRILAHTRGAGQNHQQRPWGMEGFVGVDRAHRCRT